MLTRLAVTLLLTLGTLAILPACSGDGDTDSPSEVKSNEPALAKPSAKPVAADTLRPSAGGYRDQFTVDRKTLTPHGEGKYWSLKAARRTVYRSKDGAETLAITVLRRTIEIDGATCRVVEVREDVGGQIKQITLRYLAADSKTGDLYCFGEDVDVYKNGSPAATTGTWRSGIDGARFGLALPGAPKVGMKYVQKVAPGVAMDRAEVVSVSGRQTGTWEIPGAGDASTPTAKTARWDNCLLVRESSAIGKGTVEMWYAPGVGLVRAGALDLAGMYGE